MLAAFATDSEVNSLTPKNNLIIKNLQPHVKNSLKHRFQKNYCKALSKELKVKLY